MAKYYGDPLSRTFVAVADPTRRAIVSLLHEDPRCSVSDLAEHFPLKLPGIMKHLDVLAGAELITRTKVGRVVSVELAAEPLRDARAWLGQYDAFWSGSLDKLTRHLERPR
jgi:DNA-binding transcriptional ArsR family regulator